MQKKHLEVISVIFGGGSKEINDRPKLMMDFVEKIDSTNEQFEWRK